MNTKEVFICGTFIVGCRWNAPFEQSATGGGGRFFEGELDRLLIFTQAMSSSFAPAGANNFSCGRVPTAVPFGLAVG
jgi:hypothetical protein